MTQVLATAEKIKSLEQTLKGLQRGRSVHQQSNETEGLNEVTTTVPNLETSSGVNAPATSSTAAQADFTNVNKDLVPYDAYYDTTSAVHAPRGTETGSPCLVDASAVVAALPECRVSMQVGVVLGRSLNPTFWAVTCETPSLRR